MYYISVSMQELVKAVGQLRLHIFIQGYTLVFIPIAMTMLVKLLGSTSLIAPVFLNGCVLQHVILM